MYDVYGVTVTDACDPFWENRPYCLEYGGNRLFD